MADYPDILGGITGGARLLLDVAELAFGIRPVDPAAGRPFEAILLVQNDVDCDIDVIVKLVLPAKDLKGASGRFVTKADKRIVIGLRPAEVGFVALPLVANPQTATGPGYALQIEVEITRKEKTPNRLRGTGAVPPADLTRLPEAARTVIETLRPLSYSTSAQGRAARTQATLSIPFALNAPGISKLADIPKAGWMSLWTMSEGLDAEGVAEQARRHTSVVLPQLNRRHMFFPLLKAVQAHAEDAGYRLWAGEATAITKLLVVVLETGQPAPSTTTEIVTYPRWFTHLAQTLLDNPALTSEPETIITETIFAELIYDGALAAFTNLKAATTDDLGNPEEMAEYSDGLARIFVGETAPLDLVHVYLPLVLGGLLNNSRLMMPGESALDTIELLVNARIQREAERDENNQFVFDLLDALLDRALALVDKTLTLQRYLDPIERLRYKDR